MYLLKYFILDKKIYKLLLSRGAFIDYELFKNEIAMKMIIKNLLFIKYFLKQMIRVKFDDINISLITEPLIFSIKLNNTKLVKKLLQNHANLYERDSNNNDVMTIAKQIGNQDIIDLLNKYKFNKKI